MNYNRHFKKIMLAGGLLLGLQCYGQDVTPVISYSFENQKAADDNGTYEGKLMNNASIVQMTDGNSVLYTGAGYMDITAAAGKAIAATLTGNYTISVDVCISATNNLSSYCWLYSFANGTSQYLGLINTAGNGNWYYEIKNSSTLNVKSNTGLTTKVWHNITVVQNSTTNTIYIDGVAKNSGTVSISPSSFASSITGCYLGKSPFAADGLLTSTFIDNFKIYNSALTADQVAVLNTTAQAHAATTTANIATNLTRMWESTGNPVVTHKYTCDPAAFVHNDTLYIFTGQDAAGGQTSYKINNWCCFATTDMKHFWEYNTPIKATDFSWATSTAAWAGQVVERNGKYYWYISSNTTGIGVGVADRPEGPYKDALGRALLTNSNSPGMTHSWRTIDPTVFIDDDGQAWLMWGNGACWCCKLNPDMISYDTSYGIKMLTINGSMDFSYTEAPWIHKKDGMYYLSFAAGFPERIEYAVSDKINGPYTYKGILNEIAGNSNTNHQAVVQYKNNWYFVYHNGGIQTDGGSYSRSLCIDKLEFDENGMYKPVIMTTKGVDMLEAPVVNQIKEITANSVNSPFKLDAGSQTITMTEKSRFQIVDAIGRVVKAGNSQTVNIGGMDNGLYIISNGEESWKFIKK